MVDGYTETAVESLAAHRVYLSVLDPDTPVEVQARRQVEMTTRPRPEFGDRPAVDFILRRARGVGADTRGR